MLQNNFYVEKNPTIVTFPVKNLELRDHVKICSDLGFPTDEELAGSSVSELKDLLKTHKVSWSGCVEKADLIDRVKTEVLAKIITKYVEMLPFYFINKPF